MRKFVFGAALAALLTFGAFGQALGMGPGGYLGRENLVLIWLNALELSPAQMKALLDLVEGLLPLREEIVNMPEELHKELLSFQGAPKELRELLASYGKKLQEKLEALEDTFISGLKKILTVAQWERLKRGILWEEPRAPMREGEGRRVVPRPWPERPVQPPAYLAPRLELLRGMTLVRLLPTLHEVLSAKLEALGK